MTADARSAKPLSELLAPDWAQALAPVAPVIAQLGDFLRAEVAAGRRYLPAGAHVLRAFTRPMADVRVLVVGQDPYPTPGHAMGLSFSVAPTWPRSRGRWPTSTPSTAMTSTILAPAPATSRPGPMPGCCCSTGC